MNGSVLIVSTISTQELQIVLFAGSYTEQQAKGAMFRVLSALTALEYEKVVHRDLKVRYNGYVLFFELYLFSWRT